MTTTCKPCGATFGGRAEHCTGCHATFSGTTAGDMHRTGDHAVSSGPARRRCLTALEMIDKGMYATHNAQGTPIWGTGRGQNPFKSLAPFTTDGLAGSPWGNVPQVVFSARKSEVGAG